MHKSIFLGLAVASNAFAAVCQPASPADCNRDSCSSCFCLGPATVQGNAPVNPRTCDGDVVISASALYWKAQQDGMEYAVETNSGFERIQIIDADYKTPQFKHNIGYRFGLGYRSACDGWGVGIIWTNFKGKASSENSTDIVFVGSFENLDFKDNRMLLPIWSAFSGLSVFSNEHVLVAGRIDTSWFANFNVVDLDLGRQYWTSKYLSCRPHLGIRGVSIKQDFAIEHRGGTWTLDSALLEPPYNDYVNIDNNYDGIGVRSGLDLNWNFGCGWSIYNEFAASLIYGKFHVKHDEMVRMSESPFSKQQVMATKDSFRASRGIIDLALGIQYSSLICDCKYGITAKLGWEQHYFFHQNQMARVNRIGSVLGSTLFPNNYAGNAIQQCRGTLDTSGLTFTFAFDF